jgi:hypothetical protein
MRRLAGVIGLAVLVSLAVIEPSGDINSIEERARTFFARFVEMSHAFDPAVADFYADEARVVSVRKYPQDAERTLDMRGVQYKPLIRSVMPLAKARGDRNTYTDVLYQRQGERVWIRATRYSALKKDSSPYALLVGPDGAGKWLIYKEHGSTRP